MTAKQKRMLLRILISAALLLACALLPVRGTPRLLLFLAPYFLVGYDVLWKAVRNIAHGQVFDENFLMCVATIGALAVGEYPEAVAVMLFYQVGELFQSYAVGRSRKSISALMDIRPDSANLEQADGTVAVVDPEEVPVGSVIVVKPGEKIPLDGTVLEGSSLVDTSALTGESVPRQLAPGGEAMSGCINQSGVLRITVTKEFGASTVSKILDLVENASSKKARAENFITKFARYYTPIVVFAAVALAALPTLLFRQPFEDWLMRALNFLVVSCPCALVISVPLSFFGGIGGASRSGILIKGGNYMETLADAEVAVFDKTGTLTKGTFRVTQTVPQEGVAPETLLEIAALAESGSNHPISQSLRAAWGQQVPPDRVGEIQEIAGRGVQAQVDSRTVLAGNAKLMQQASVTFQDVSLPGTVVHVAADGKYLGYLLISDEVKPNAKEAIAKLKAAGIRRTVMLTGDNRTVAQAVAEQLGVDEVHAELLPGDKVGEVEKLMGQKSGSLVFMGDGINDAPVLARADVGVAMGALGSDAAIEAADIVLMDDDPAKLAAAVRISRRTLRIVRQNIVFALAVKLLVLVLSALGLANMWAAVFADVGVTVIAILNSMRALRTEE
ncbi:MULTISPECIES: heavy metal translocating P-type ATPase [Caproicibacterium]|uniref:Cd(2+)-exporting ATPase n=1 Tax=Caproicibacterium argilliputei TaxID=3030016 RepID=A0AA97D8J5_9FIRM|nr:heavy metal translocating P-type ATPase [Caproicibacterium argilliputei]WOC32540.1 heavy metal translocating P-type ATPase [Caproicibacterium argilliputei]